MADGGLRQIIQDHLKMVDWCPIETGASAPGVPDLNGCVEGVELWIECKTTASHTIKFRPMQPGWLSRRHRHGGTVWVAARRVHVGGRYRGPPVDELWLYHGSQVLELADVRGRMDLIDPYHIFYGGPSRWEWHLIGQTLHKSPHDI